MQKKFQLCYEELITCRGSCAFSKWNEEDTVQWCRNPTAHGTQTALHHLCFTKSCSRKASFVTPILQVAKADRNNTFQVTQRIRTEMSHCNPAHLSNAPLPLLTASSSPGTQPFSFGVILAGFHHQIYTLDWPFLPSVHPHTTSTSSTVTNWLPGRSVAGTACYSDLWYKLLLG